MCIFTSRKCYPSSFTITHRYFSKLVVKIHYFSYYFPFLLSNGSRERKELLTAEECPAAPRVQSTKDRNGREAKTSNTSPSITGIWLQLSPYLNTLSSSNSFSDQVLLLTKASVTPLLLLLLVLGFWFCLLFFFFFFLFLLDVVVVVEVEKLVTAFRAKEEEENLECDDW